MNKKIFSIIMAAVMVCSVICTAVPETASAASKSKKVYMTTGLENSTDSWQPREKVGDYYIWVDSKYNNGTYSSSLKCAKSLKKGKAKTLRKVTSKTKQLDQRVVTNGKAIYYDVYDWKTGKGTIYKTTVKGSTHKKVKIVKNFAGVAAFYGGKIYYNAHKVIDSYGYDEVITHLYSYDIAKKKTQLEKKEYVVDSGYGRYMSGRRFTAPDVDVYAQLYDAKTGKSTSLVESFQTVISGKTVYYVNITYDTYNFDNYDEAYCEMNCTLKKCDLSGKNKKTIKKVKNMYPHYLGRKAVYFKDDNTGKIKKLTYRTKKLTTVK